MLSVISGGMKGLKIFRGFWVVVFVVGVVFGVFLGFFLLPQAGDK